MGSTSKNNFFDSCRSADEERGFVTHVKQFGGVEPHEETKPMPSVSRSSPNYLQTSGGDAVPSGTAQCSASFTRSFNKNTVSSSPVSCTGKGKPLMALLLPKDVGKSVQRPLLRKETLIGKETGGVQVSGRSSKSDINASALDDDDDDERGERQGEGEESRSDDDSDAAEEDPHDALKQHDAAWTQPLEDRLCLEELRQLMGFFSTSCNFFDASVSDVPPKDNSTWSNSANDCPASSSSHPQKGTSEVLAAVSSCSVEPHVTREESASNGKLGTGKSFFFSIRSRNGKRYPLKTREDLQQVLTSHDTLNHVAGSEAYTRVLNEKQLLQAVKAVCPDARDEDIMDLMRKVDYEDRGCTTWEEFSTFLVSHGNHRLNIAQGTVAELLSQPEPKSCLPSSQHVLGTCMEADVQSNLLLTGGSEGTVRIWDLDTLTSRGIVFSGDCWVVGVHWANQTQGIFIVTMDRKLIILDLKTLEVKRLYRGRSVVDSAPGYMYAHDSVQSVRVGGKTTAGPTLYDGGTRASPTNEGGADGGRCEKKRVLPSARRSSPAKRGRGPHAQCYVEECTLADLMDSVSCSLFHHTALREDMVLLATVIGEVRFYAIPKIATRVVSPRVVIRLHEKRINKMSIMFDNNALLTASDDGLVKMTSLDTGVLLRTFVASGPEQHSAVHDFAVDPQLRLLVTVGPERYGIVWEFSHDTPMAILDAHNSPCRCCAVRLSQAQIITCGSDGVIFIFDSKGFHLMQVLHAHQFYPQRVMHDEKRLRLLCLATYPYFHGQQHHSVCDCSSKYQGHMASMVGVIYNKTYDLIVTIDVEGLVMTWKRFNGAPVFAFQLKDFSDSAVMNAARLGCFVMDGLGRRLLTGFNNGVVAVWNLVNGQTIHVITAAAECLTTTTVKPEVTALGSLIRDGITFFVFALSGKLFSTRESSMFTIASATKWDVPEKYGDVLVMQPISPQILVCGSSSGALIFYHILAERQEGSALWVIDKSEPLRRLLQSPSETQRVEQGPSVVTSRVIKIFALQAISAHVIMAVHSDGTVALWHTMRRLLMETVSVRGSFPTSGEETSMSHVAMDCDNQYFVFADGQGNIHVCSIKLCAVPDAGSVRLPRLPQMQGQDGNPLLHWPGSPFEHCPQCESAAEEKASAEGSDIGSLGEQGKWQNIVEEKVPYVFSKFCQEYVFHCGFPSVSAVSFIDPPKQDAPHCQTGEEKKKKEEEEGWLDAEKNDMPRNSNNNKTRKARINERPYKRSASGASDTAMSFVFAPPIKYCGMIAVSSGGDNFTRLFTLDGMIIGECGMNRWKIGNSSTYEFLGAKPSRRLPPHFCSVHTMDFLHEMSAPERNCNPSHVRARSARSTLRVNVPRRGSFTYLSLASGLDSSVTLNSLFSETLRGSNQANCASAQTPGMDGLERSEQQQQQQQLSEKNRSEGPLSPSKFHMCGEPVTLSTKMRTRRTRDAHLWGLVKGEFIKKLRRLPMEDVDEALTTHELVSSVSNASKGLIRTEVGNENPSPLPTFSANRVNEMVTEDSVDEEVGVGSDTQGPSSQAGAPFSSSSVHNHVRRWNAGGTVVRKSVILSAAEEGGAARSTTIPTNRTWATANTTTSFTDDESPRIDVIRGHLESQRRMLLILGRKDSVLEGMLPDQGVTCTDGPTKEMDSVASYKETLAARRLRALPLMAGKNRVAQITSRLQVVHLEKILPPKGTETFELSVSTDGMKRTNATVLPEIEVEGNKKKEG